MLSIPSLHAGAAIVLVICTFWAFARLRLRIEYICLGAIGIMALGLYFFPIYREGVGEYTGMEVAFGGFGHPALVAICCLMIIGRGLVVTGALEPAARAMGRLWRYSSALGLLASILAGALMSMVVNDTPVLVLTLPILLNAAMRAGVAPSKTLMPVNFAILIGGMATTIGTSTNLLVVGIAADLGVPRFGVFEFADIALAAGLIALPYLWFVMPLFLPSNSAAAAQKSRSYEAALHVTDGSPLVGLTLEQAGAKAGKGVEVNGATRFGRALGGDAALFTGDVVQVEGAMSELRHASDDLKSPLAPPHVMQRVLTSGERGREDEVMAELVIGSDSPLIGHTVRTAQIVDRYGVAVLGLHRPEAGAFRGGQEALLRIGDVLLVRGLADNLRQLEIAEGAMVLEGAAEMPRTALAPVALLIASGVVVAATLGIVPIVIAALAGTIAMLVTGCVKFERLGRALSAEVIVVVAASIALGRGLLETGAAEWLGEVLAFLLQSAPPAVALAAAMMFAALLTNFASNTAAAAVTTPISVSLAHSLGLAPEPFVLAALFGCNLCYATPMAYQTNMLIMTAGGYSFRDYMRAGGPLVILMTVTLSLLLVSKYHL